MQIWDKEVVNGQIKRLQDEDIQSNVLEIVGPNVNTTYITCPADPVATLGIKIPFVVMIVKNLKKYLTFEIQILDYKNVRRCFRASNYQVSRNPRHTSMRKILDYIFCVGYIIFILRVYLCKTA